MIDDRLSYSNAVPPMPVVAGTLVLVALLGVLAPVRAQVPDSARAADARHTVALRDVPLGKALQTFISKTDVDLAYSTALVEGQSVYCRLQEATTDRLLSCILEGTGVDYVRTSSGSYLLVDSVELAPMRGRIAGTVVDATTGEPLPNANVLLADAGTGTSTNRAGRFAVAPVLPGAHRLVVTYVGYTTAIDSVQVPPRGRDTVRVALRRRVLRPDPIVIDGLQQRLPAGALGRSDLDGAQLTRLSGVGTPSVLRNTAQQIGVALNRPLAQISVQGGDGGEHVTLLDGIPIREPVRLGGLVGAFSPLALDRMTVHTAGFGASHGSYTAGVLEASHDLARSDARYAAGSTDPLSVNGRTELSWGAGSSDGGKAMVAARVSPGEVYRSPSLHDLLEARTALDVPLTPAWTGEAFEGGRPTRQERDTHVQFSDVHAAVRQDLTPFQSVSVSGYRGNARLGTDVASALAGGEDARLLFSQDRYTWTNTAVQGRYEWLAGSRVTGTVQLRGSVHDSDTFFGLRDSVLTSPVGSLPLPGDGDRLRNPHSAEGNRISEWGGHAEVDLSVSPDVHVRAAVTPQYLNGRFRVRNPFLGILEHESSDWQIGSYAEATVSPTPRLTATAGARLTYVQARETVYAEPRLSLRYDRSSTSVGNVAVRLAGGLYRQYTMQSEISSAGPTSVVPSVQFWLPIDRSVAPARAYHAAGSVLLAPTSSWTARVEAYYKRQPRTLQVDYAELARTPTGTGPPPRRALRTQSDFMTAGTGTAYGAALHLQRDGPRVSSSLSAEWDHVRRRYPDRFDGRSVPAPWEQPFRLTTAVDVRLIGGLHGLFHWQGIWGRPWALRRAYYDYLAPLDEGDALGPFDVRRPGDQVLAPFSRVDLGLEAERTLGRVTVETKLRLVNVLDRHNPFDWSLDSTGARAEPVKRTLPGRRFFVLVGLRY